MVLSFTGEHTQRVDGKGRMSIPADFRRVLESGDPEWNPGQNARMYLLYGDHLKDQLHGYTVSEFDDVMAMIKSLPRGSEKKRRLSKYFIGRSIRLEIDKDGRTVMPIRQREKLGVDDSELYFQGMGDHFEIWKAETHKAKVGDADDLWLAEQGDDFDVLSLLDD